MSAPCGHCGTRARHGERIGCCSLCGVLYASQTAFEKHIHEGVHLPPADVGLVARHPKSDPAAVMWGLPGTYRHEEKP